jgi:hypothetical protein
LPELVDFKMKKRHGAFLSAVCCLVALSACGQLVDPPLPSEAQRYAAPGVYARWWAMTEACSALSAPLASIVWYDAPKVDNPAAASEPITGYWSMASNRIVIREDAVLEGGVVRHEMLHALLKSGGHPRQFFLGKCAGVVDCADDCIADGGLPRPVDPSSVLVTPDDLEVNASVDPPSPSATVGDGFFEFTVTVRNPSSKPVVVALPTPRFADDLASTFGYDIRGPFGGGSSGFRIHDSSVVRFQPGEIKRQVFDFRLLGLFASPGMYTAAGSYGGHRVTIGFEIRP